MSRKKTFGHEKHLWYKDAVIYELHIKAFCDGNADGIGDFKGLLEKLDYLQELGVTAIWVLPFYPSPQKDDGYDIADYYKINSSYGKIEDFKKFLAEAHRRRLKVITELVINHTSDQHPWFQRARNAPKGSPERSYYVWTDDPNGYSDVRIIFQDFEASNWTWDPVAQQYYWHRFFHHQPDLNYDNPQVQDEVFKIIDYWCEMGVDGFRLDAVPYLFEREGTNGENLPETHAFLKKLRKHVDEKFPSTVLLAEANMWPEDSASYFGDGDECHMNYHFPVMPRMFMALQMEDRYPITDIFDQTPAIPDNCQWAMFLRNHDELTLEMVTDEERDYMYKVYAKDPKAKINLGIRHRLAPLMDNDRRKIELMNSLLFSLTGTPVIYYGDEIGMGDNFYLGDRDGVRTPMQWSPDRNAGFSDSNPHRLYLPVILDAEYHYQAVNVETQRRNTSSLFWFMKRIINMRKKYRAFSRGDMKFIDVDNPKVLAFTRHHEDQTLLVVVNLSKFSQPAELDLPGFKGYVPVEVYSKNRFPVIETDKPYFLTLGPHSFQWFHLQKTRAPKDVHIALPELQLSDWNEFLHSDLPEELAGEILYAYLPKMKWFMGRGRVIHTIAISQSVTISLPDYNAFLLLIDVSYDSGLPETYQLPISFVKNQLASKIAENCPQAVIAKITVGTEQGILCDATFTPNFQRLMINMMGKNEIMQLEEGELSYYANEALSQFLRDDHELKVKLFTNSENYTSITYDNKFFLKMYRKVERTTNPDFEVTKFLTEKRKFPYIPALTGAIEWNNGAGSLTMGMMQLMIENHGDGYSFMLERINNYIERILARRSQFPGDLESAATLTVPKHYDELPDNLKSLLGSNAPQQASLFGTRIGQLHLELASGTEREFSPEEFSLHYQRSLYSSMQSLVRETLDLLGHRMKDFSIPTQQQAMHAIAGKNNFLEILKRIYSKKLDVVKIRTQGNLVLSKILFTGRDIAIQDFTGDAFRSFSEIRLKRSPLRDVASMIRSFHYVAYDGFFSTSHVQKEEIPALFPFAELWSYYISGFFMQSYLEVVKHTEFIPAEQEDFEVLLLTYLLDGAMHDINSKLKTNGTGGLSGPLRIINSILDSN